MPKFYLHLCENGHRVQDTEGMDLRDLLEARAEAVAAAREILADAMRNGTLLSSGWFEIAGAGGVLLSIVHFREAYQTR
jgi:hypothetical protein